MRTRLHMQLVCQKKWSVVQIQACHHMHNPAAYVDNVPNTNTTSWKAIFSRCVCSCNVCKASDCWALSQWRCQSRATSNMFQCSKLRVQLSRQCRLLKGRRISDNRHGCNRVCILAFGCPAINIGIPEAAGASAQPCGFWVSHWLSRMQRRVLP